MLKDSKQNNMMIKLDGSNQGQKKITSSRTYPTTSRIGRVQTVTEYKGQRTEGLCRTLLWTISM